MSLTVTTYVEETRPHLICRTFTTLFADNDDGSEQVHLHYFISDAASSSNSAADTHHSSRSWIVLAQDESEFDYLKDSEKGPKHWGELREEWGACKTGRLQSPVDLLSEIVEVHPNNGEVRLKYWPSYAIIKNRGHDISIQWRLGAAGSVEINGTDYWLDQCHWHSPSEHTINGNRFDLELHMVHRIPGPNVGNNIVVVAYLYKIGKPDMFLSQVSQDIKSMIDVEAERHRGVVDPRDVKQGGAKFYKYKGSLTVPPCTEGVTWIIHKKLTTVSREQMELLREAVHDL
ncbi:hypothetical protein ACLB2K_063793 [Fragaria x ananassa]